MYFPYNQLVETFNLIKNLNFNNLFGYVQIRAKQSIDFQAMDTQLLWYDQKRPILLKWLINALEDKPYLSIEEILDSLFAAKANRLYSFDGKALLLIIGTTFPEGSIDSLNTMGDIFQSSIEAVQSEYSDTTIRLAGYPVNANEELNMIRSSGERMTLWALIIIIIALRFFLGGLKQILLAMTVLLISLIFTLALTRLIYGEVNTVTMIMGLILIGLGIDFCIHWMNYHQRLRTTNLPDVHAGYHIFKKGGVPIYGGAVTTAGAFMCLLVFDMQSIHEFAWMSAIGILLTATIVLFFMPLLMYKTDPFKSNVLIRRVLISIAKISSSGRKSFVIVTVIFIGVASWLLKDLEFEYNYAKLQIGGTPTYEMREEIINRFGFSSDVILQLCKGVEGAWQMKEDLGGFLEIGSIISVSDFLPSISEQRKKEVIIKEIRQALKTEQVKNYQKSDIPILKRRLRDLNKTLSHPFLADSIISVQQSLVYLDRIEDLLNEKSLPNFNQFNSKWVNAFKYRIRQLANDKEISFEHLPDQIQALFKTSESDIYVQYIFPVEDVWEKTAAEDLDAVFQKKAPLAVGLPRISLEMTRKIARDGILMAFLATLVIFIAVWLTLRHWRYTLFALLPLLFGSILTGAVMVVLGQKVSVDNLIAVPIILGIGIDNGLHLVYALKLKPALGATEALGEVGPAIFLTSVTSIIGFGCLALYSHVGLSSLGMVLSIGVACCLICTVLILPPILEYIHKRSPS